MYIRTELFCISGLSCYPAPMPEQESQDLILHKSERSYPELDPEKESLAMAIAKGMSFAKAGALVGWSRQRVRYTYHNDLSFRSAIETEKEKLQKELQNRIASSLKDTAVEAAELVSTAIKQGDEKMAFLFLKETGILQNSGLVSAKKPLDPEERERQVQRVMEQLVIMSREAQAKEISQAQIEG